MNFNLGDAYIKKMARFLIFGGWKIPALNEGNSDKYFIKT